LRRSPASSVSTRRRGAGGIKSRRGCCSVRRDLTAWARSFFFALLGLLVFGIVAIFVSIPRANVIYGVLGLVIFGGFTVIDFNRLRRTSIADAVPIAASIFLDIFNVFLLLIELFGGGRD
jgi:modulator of FtsH protease